MKENIHSADLCIVKAFRMLLGKWLQSAASQPHVCISREEQRRLERGMERSAAGARCAHEPWAPEWLSCSAETENGEGRKQKEKGGKKKKKARSKQQQVTGYWASWVSQGKLNCGATLGAVGMAAGWAGGDWQWLHHTWIRSSIHHLSLSPTDGRTPARLLRGSFE